jgi:hypothetical protein
LLFGEKLYAAELVGIESKEALIAEIVQGFVEAGLVVAGKGKDAGISSQCDVAAAARGHIISNQEFV